MEKEKERAKKADKAKTRNPNSVIRDIVTRKVRLFPTIEQKDVLRRAVGTYRWVYNRAVHLINSKECKLSEKELRMRCVNDGVFANENKWVLDMPYEIRDQAMKEAKGAFSSNIAKKKKGVTKLDKFEVKFKRKRAGYGEVKILARGWTEKGLHPRSLKMGKIKSSEPIPDDLYADTNIYCENHRWYMTVPYERKSENLKDCERKGKIAVIDPGVRTFATVYDPSRDKCIQWGAGDFSRITRLGAWMDDLTSRMSKVKARQRYQMKKALNRMRERVKNLVNDLHKKFAHWLRTNYEFVLLPTFNAHDMNSRGVRKIRNKTVRAMMCWSHGRFRTRLGDRLQFIPVTEEYTSKTCSGCGVINHKLGGAKVFDCKSCGLRADRDCNGAKNIFLKALFEILGLVERISNNKRVGSLI